MTHPHVFYYGGKSLGPPLLVSCYQMASFCAKHFLLDLKVFVFRGTEISRNLSSYDFLLPFGRKKSNWNVDERIRNKKKKACGLFCLALEDANIL